MLDQIERRTFLVKISAFLAIIIFMAAAVFYIYGPETDASSEMMAGVITKKTYLSRRNGRIDICDVRIGSGDVVKATCYDYSHEGEKVSIYRARSLDGKDRFIVGQ